MTNNNNSLLDHPAFEKSFDNLIIKLLKESNRGAVLIGASHIEDQLAELVKAILPNQSKKYTSRLLNYPGPISSFSSKIELSFAFRLINENLYDSLNSLRKIRNLAAHSSSEFSFDNYRKELDNIFELGPGMTVAIRNGASKMLVQMKAKTLQNHFANGEFDKDEISSITSELIKDEKVLEEWEKQVPHWELIYGLSIISTIIAHCKDDALIALGDNSTWKVVKK